MKIVVQKIREKFIGLPSYLKDWALTFKGGVTIMCLVVLFCIPLLTQQVYYLEVVILAMIYSIFAASWDFLAGFTGQVSFGHAIFYGLSGYVTSAILVEVFNKNSDWWWLALILGVLVSVGVGFIIGIICLRLKGPYLALGTMTIGLLLMNLFRIGPLKEYLWGDEGISGVPALNTNSNIVFFVTLILMIISITTMIHISKSNIGTIFKSIRDDETGSESSGINTTTNQLIDAGTLANLQGGHLAKGFRKNMGPMKIRPGEYK